ncbi:MAG: membrane protein insertion efficiency factor YidD [Bdellovibrionota bacterium]
MKRSLMLAIRFYQFFISPFMHILLGSGSGCRFHPNCSTYALECLANKSLLQAFSLIFKRILRCHPYNEGGVDSVPK